MNKICFFVFKMKKTDRRNFKKIGNTIFGGIL